MKLRKLFRTRNGLAMRRLENLIRNGRPFRMWKHPKGWVVATPYAQCRSCSLDAALRRAIEIYVWQTEKKESNLRAWVEGRIPESNPYLSRMRSGVHVIDLRRSPIEELEDKLANEWARAVALHEDRHFGGKSILHSVADEIELDAEATEYIRRLFNPIGVRPSEPND